MRTVMTTAGAVMGEKSGIQKITVFRGIPYAAAPVGEYVRRMKEAIRSAE